MYTSSEVFPDIPAAKLASTLGIQKRLIISFMNSKYPTWMLDGKFPQAINKDQRKEICDFYGIIQTEPKDILLDKYRGLKKEHQELKNSYAELLEMARKIQYILKYRTEELKELKGIKS